MNLNKLATVTTAGNNSVFTYDADAGEDFTAMGTDGFFDEAVNSFGNRTLILATSSNGLSFHLVSSADGVSPVTTADNLVTLAVNANGIESHTDGSFQGIIDNDKKITRAEIESVITEEGLDLPVRNVTIYINDIVQANKQFLCRYDKVQDEWFFELLKRAH